MMDRGRGYQPGTYVGGDSEPGGVHVVFVDLDAPDHTGAKNVWCHHVLLSKGQAPRVRPMTPEELETWGHTCESSSVLL